jgi:hypothetical protein
MWNFGLVNRKAMESHTPGRTVCWISGVTVELGGEIHRLKTELHDSTHAATEWHLCFAIIRSGFKRLTWSGMEANNRAQNLRNRSRCQRTTVSSFTYSSGPRQPRQTRDKRTNRPSRADRRLSEPVACAFAGMPRAAAGERHSQQQRLGGRSAGVERIERWTKR